MCLHTQSQTKDSTICFLSDQHRQLKALCDQQQRRGWVAPEQTQYPTSKLCDPKQQPSFNTGIVWFGILVQDTKKKDFFHVVFKEVKAYLLLTVSSFVRALLSPRNEAVLKNQQPPLKMQKPTVCFVSNADQHILQLRSLASYCTCNK